MSFCTMYWPPVGSMSRQQYVDLTRALADEYTRFLDSCVTRTTPITFLDLNDGLGLRMLATADSQGVGSIGRQVPTSDHSDAIGTCEPFLEKAGGTLFRSIVESHSCCVVNSHFYAGRTYFGNRGHGGSKLDYIVCPQGMLHNVSSCRLATHCVASRSNCSSYGTTHSAIMLYCT